MCSPSSLSSFDGDFVQREPIRGVVVEIRLFLLLDGFLRRVYCLILIDLDRDGIFGVGYHAEYRHCDIWRWAKQAPCVY